MRKPLEKHTKKELLDMARGYYLSGYSGLKKNDLIKFILDFSKKRIKSYERDLKHFRKKLKLNQESLERFDKNISDLGYMELKYIEQERDKYGISRTKMRDMILHSLKKDIKYGKKAMKNLTDSIEEFRQMTKN